MKRRSARPYLILLGSWLAVTLLGSIVGAAADGVDSIVPNFLRYGVSIGAILAFLLALAYLFDARQSSRNR